MIVHFSPCRIGAWIALCLFASCSSLDIPSIEQSEKTIATLRPLLKQSDEAINTYGQRIPSGNDLIFRLKLSALNTIATTVAGQRTDDVRIAFLPTRPFLREDKSILGIKYANSIDIDTGNLIMNLRVFRFDRCRNNIIDAIIGIDGRGKIKLSGRYTGIPASASPFIDMTLDETIHFDIVLSDSGCVQLRPRKQQLVLHTTFSVKIIEWQIPWSKDIPLEVTDLIPPIDIPMAFGASIPFPIPSPEYGDERLTFIPHAVEFFRTIINASNDVLEVRTDFRFSEKQK